jgi:hypothetical protein
MMDNTSSLVNVLAESERIERDAWIDLFASASDSYAGKPRLKSSRFGNIGALAHPDLPITELNRAFSITQASEGELDAGKLWLENNAMTGWAIQVPDVMIERLSSWLSANRLAPSGEWAKFYASGSTKDAPGKINIRLAEPADASLFGAVVEGGYGLPPGFSSLFSSIVGRRNWCAYLAYEGEDAVGSGAMYCDGAWWCSGSMPLLRHIGAKACRKQ